MAPKRFLKAALVACLLLLPALAANAQAYPSKPVKLVVPWPAGGLVDALGRVVAERLQASLGQPVVVDNRPGAGGMLGAETVLKAEPDGYTLMLTTSALTINAALQPQLRFDVLKDFAPIAIGATAPSILVVHPALAAANTRELIALARSKPGSLTYASAGNGSPAHLSAELFKSVTGIEATHVPYKGAPPAMVDQIAGRIDFHFANATVALPQVRAGKVRALAITSASRSPSMPDIPTMAETGVADFEASQWLGFFAPRGTPKPIVERLATAINKALAEEDVKAALAKQGMDAYGASTPESFADFMKSDLAKWRDVVKAAKLKLE